MLPREGNVFKGALKSLSSRKKDDLFKLEEMLEGLLKEVESLKASPKVL